MLVFKAHATPGQIYVLWKSDEWGQTAGGIEARRSHLSDPWDVVVDDHVGQWDHIRAVIYMGCDTGQTSPIQGCLPEETVSAGAAWSVGWNQHYQLHQGCYWLKRFFYRACVEGMGTQSAMDSADDDAQDYYEQGYDPRLEDRNVVGTWDALTPAGYGPQ